MDVFRRLGIRLVPSSKLNLIWLKTRREQPGTPLIPLMWINGPIPGNPTMDGTATAREVHHVHTKHPLSSEP